jgi:flagellar L-ring protein precursor FlgH
MNRSGLRPALLAALSGIAILGTAAPAGATDLYKSGNWSSLASDRRAQALGDTLTVVIYETSSAVNSAQTGSSKKHRLSGQADAGGSTNSGNLRLDGAFDGSGQTGRSGKLLAQISVTVDGVLPNGDLHVSGEQTLNISGERTFIRLQGRVRAADISSANAVASTRLADVMIDYDGSGYVSRSGKPGPATRVFNWLGLM